MQMKQDNSYIIAKKFMKVALQNARDHFKRFTYACSPLLTNRLALPQWTSARFSLLSSHLIPMILTRQVIQFSVPAVVIQVS